MAYLTIIIPALNEEEKIEESITEVIIAAKIAGIDYEIVAVNDCSQDSTGRILEKLCKNNPNIKIIHNSINLGFGGSYKKALEIASGEYITWVPGDLSHRSNSFKYMFESIGAADIIIPVPINMKARSIKRRIISRLYTWTINLVTGLKVPYYNGLSIHRASFLRQITIETNGFGFQAEIIVKLIKTQSASYLTVDTEVEERKAGLSKAFTKKNIAQVVNVISTLRNI